METAYSLQPQQNKISTSAGNIESQTPKRLKNMMLWALVAISSSMILKVVRKKQRHSFISKWIAPVLLYGICNKLVKQFKHSETEKL